MQDKISIVNQINGHNERPVRFSGLKRSPLSLLISCVVSEWHWVLRQRRTLRDLVKMLMAKEPALVSSSFQRCVGCQIEVLVHSGFSRENRRKRDKGTWYHVPREIETHSSLWFYFRFYSLTSASPSHPFLLTHQQIVPFFQPSILDPLVPLYLFAHAFVNPHTTKLNS